MRHYTVHLRRHGLDPDRDIVLVKEGFSWPAFLFSFLWALRHRLWLASAAIFLAVAAVNAAIYWLRPDVLSQAVLSLGLGVIIGYLGNDLRRRKLTHQGFAFAGAVSGADPDQALRRYLDNQPALAVDLKS